jgi:DNA-binding NarL/FixJ family response regulator
MITVLIVESNARLGHVLGQLLDDDPRFRHLGVVSSTAKALQAAEQHRPDVVLVSQRLDAAQGAAVCAALRAAVPASVLLLWSNDASATERERPDVDGVLERGMTYRELALAVRDAYRRRQVQGRVVDLTDERSPHPTRG